MYLLTFNQIFIIIIIIEESSDKLNAAEEMLQTRILEIIPGLICE